MRNEDALEMVGEIYDAAFEPKRWVQVLTRIGNAVGSVQECLQVHAPKSQSFAMMAPRRDPDYQQSFHDQWMKDGVWRGLTEKLFALPVGRIIDLRELLSSEEFTRTGFYNDWWQAQDLGPAALIAKLPAGEHRWCICGVHKRPADDFTGQETALFKAIAPHMARAFSLHNELARLAVRDEMDIQSSMPGKGIVCIDKNANILFADDEADALLQTAPELQFEGGRLVPAYPEAAAALGRLIDKCTDRGVFRDGAGGTLALPRIGGGVPIEVKVLPTRTQAGLYDDNFFGLFRPAAILTIFDPERELRQRIAELQERFNLTPAEAAFTIEILKGDGREAAAARVGITLSTARTHLMRIFDKVGVNRQAELVRVLANNTGDTNGHSASPM